MTWPVQDHADAFLALLRAPASPPVSVLDGAVPNGTVAPYALVYFYIETPDGLTEPDKVPFTFDSDVINARAYVHCVGGNAMAARGVAGWVRDTVLNRTLTVAGRSCFPIRWREGQPPQRNEETGVLVMDQVDIYGWTSVPG